jgi:hypothetical protein
MDQDTRYAILAASLCGAVVLSYKLYDPYQNIERYYFKESRIEYGILKAAYFVVFVSGMLGAKYIMHNIMLNFKIQKR